MIDFPWAKGVTKYYGKGKLQFSELYTHLSTNICTSRRQGALLPKALWLGSSDESAGRVRAPSCLCCGAVRVGWMRSPLGSSVGLR